MIMKKSIVAFGLSLLLVVSPALAAPVISIGTQYMLNTNATRIIPIMVSSATHEQIEALYLAVQIGDGGSVNGGGNTAPRITNLDIVGPGTIFSASHQDSGTPVYQGTPALIGLAETLTVSGTLDANGVLAYLTVNPNSAAVGSYAISLQNVGQNIATGPWSSSYDSASPFSYSGSGAIQIVALHQSKWNKNNNGLWTESTWTSNAPPVPNYTTQAIVDTPYTVDVTSAQEADSLALSGGGKVAIGSSGSLAITQGVTVSAGGTLSLASGSTLNATGIQLNGGTISGNTTLAQAVVLSGGTLDAPSVSDILNVNLSTGGSGGLNKTGAGTAVILGNATYSGDTTIAAGCLQFKGLNSVLHAISGAGALSVGNGTTSSVLSADSIGVSTLTIAAGSTITINAIPGGPLSGGNSLAAVPEPSTIALLIGACLGMLFYCRRQ